MKTLLLVLMPLLMFSGCVHKVPAGHTIASRHTIPVYLKVGVVKKEHTHNHVGGKKLHRYNAKYQKRHILHPKPYSYATDHRSKMKNRKVIEPKVHPRYQDRKKHRDKDKNEREEKKLYP